MKRCILQIVAGCLVFGGLAGNLSAEETNSTVVSIVKTNESASASSEEALRAYLQLQAQLHEAQLAIDRARQETEEAAARNAETLATRLQAIEQSVASQRAREWDALQSQNRMMLVVAGGFAGVGFIAMLLTAFLQWRAVNRLSQISSAPAGFALPPPAAMAALGVGDAHLMTAGAVDQTNGRLLGVIERLEKRILELEHTARPALHENTTGDADRPASEVSAALPTLPAVDSSKPGKTGHIELLLGKGQALLNLNQMEKALACLDEALEIEPNNVEVLLKKGAALEKLNKLNEAIECYDHAIAADSSVTIAYLYKGGVYNRMERFDEALNCYEQALHTQEKNGVAEAAP